MEDFLGHVSRVRRSHPRQLPRYSVTSGGRSPISRPMWIPSPRRPTCPTWAQSQACWHPGWNVPVPGVRITVGEGHISRPILPTASAPVLGTEVAWSIHRANPPPVGRSWQEVLPGLLSASLGTSHSCRVVPNSDFPSNPNRCFSCGLFCQGV
jgi:hypothetical protein